MIVIQVDVQRGYDAFMVLVLQFGQLFAEEPDMVIVDDGHRPDYGGVGFLRAFPPVPRAQIAKGLRPVGVPLFSINWSKRSRSVPSMATPNRRKSDIRLIV